MLHFILCFELNWVTLCLTLDESYDQLFIGSAFKWMVLNGLPVRWLPSRKVQHWFLQLQKNPVAISPTTKKPFQQLYLSNEITVRMHYLKELGQLKQVSKFLLTATEMRSVQRWLQWQFLHFFRNLWYHFCRCWTSGNRNSLIYGLLYWMDMKTKQKNLLGFSMEKGGLLSRYHQSSFWLFGAPLANVYLLSLTNVKVCQKAGKNLQPLLY